MATPIHDCGLEEGRQDKDERNHAPIIAGYGGESMVKALFSSAKQEQLIYHGAEYMECECTLICK